jgi:3-hydroxyisobutyrate dehydrogenase-like beta-hydroxyacid dehydrogenase
MDVAVIGLGKMGSAMACNLIKAGHALTVYNRTRTRAEPLQPLGARIAATPTDAARAAEILITMLAAAEEAAVPMPLASLVHDRFVAALAQGLAESDWSIIARLAYQNAGLSEPTK